MKLKSVLTDDMTTRAARRAVIDQPSNGYFWRLFMMGPSFARRLGVRQSVDPSPVGLMADMNVFLRKFQGKRAWCDENI